MGLQAEKEALLRTIKDQEAEIASLRQAVQLHQTTLQQERDRHQREMTALQNQLQEKVSATSCDVEQPSCPIKPINVNLHATKEHKNERF